MIITQNTIMMLASLWTIKTKKRQYKEVLAHVKYVTKSIKAGRKKSGQRT